MPKSMRWKLPLVIIAFIVALLYSFPVKDTVVKSEQVEEEWVLGIRSKTKTLKTTYQAWYERFLPHRLFRRKVVSKLVEVKETDSDTEVRIKDVSYVLPGQISLGLDLRGGSVLIYEIKIDELTDEQKKDVTRRTMNILKKRIDPQGVHEISLRPHGAYRIEVELPGWEPGKVEKIKEVLNRTGQLEFRLVATEEEIQQAKSSGIVPPDHKWYVDYGVKAKEGEPRPKLLIKVEDKYNLTGEMLARAHPSSDQVGMPAVGFEFNPLGSKIFARLTQRFVGRRLAIILDDKLVSAPNIKGRIAGKGEITGNFTVQEVNDLVTILQSGSLMAPIEKQSERTVGPKLGEDSIRRGSRAIIIGVILVAVFMLVYYLAAGCIADFALLFNLVLILAFLSMLDATLTLPGIAGLVLTVGMAVDANVLIFERIREEKARGRTMSLAIANGYQRAFWTIFDANITTLITALILYNVGTSQIRGFAVTLSLGIIMSMFTSLFVTRVIFEVLHDKGVITKCRMLQFFKTPKIPFMKVRRIFFVISAVVIVLGLVAFFSSGSRIYDIDFTGGHSIQVLLDKPLGISDVRGRIVDSGYKSAEVQSVGEAGEQGEILEFMVRVQALSEEQRHDKLTKDIEAALEAKEVYGSVEAKGENLYLITMVEATSVEEIAEIISQTGYTANGLRESGDGVANSFAFEVPKFTEAKIQERLKSDLAAAFEKELAVRNIAVSFTSPEGEDTPEGDETDGATAPAEQTRLVMMFQEPIDLSLVRSRVAAAGYASFEVRGYGDDEGKSDCEQVLLSGVSGDLTKIKSDIGAAFRVPDPFGRVTDIGPQVASEMTYAAIKAIIGAFIVIMVYVRIRFGDFKYGLSAIAALVHDVCVTMGVIAIASWVSGTPIGDFLRIGDIKISLPVVAAFLTIIGYSLNDTIVVFDRIRENLAGMKSRTFTDVIDASINQTLSRTVLTSVTTLLVVIVLYLVGGVVIHGFAFALLVGVLVGTYSSIFVASPLLVEWHRKKAGQSANSKKS